MKEAFGAQEIGLYCFLHDAELKRATTSENGVALFLALGYPFMEETAYSELECRLHAPVTLQLSADGKPPFRYKDLSWVADGDHLCFEVLQASLNERSWELKVEGYVYAPAFNWFRVISEGTPPIWFADGNEVTLEQMIAMGERQWTLWSERGDARRRNAAEDDGA